LLKWGLIGAGDIVRKRVAAALRDAKGSGLVAVSRARADLAESFAASIGVRKWHARWEDLIVDPNIDAVYVATPVRYHAEQSIAAAQAGKHVLCEKPMAITLADCDRMIDAGRANGVKLGIAYYRHFYPLVARIKSLLDAGEIGTPVVAQMEAFERFNPQPDDPRSWLLQRSEAGGGPMMDFGCHRVEVLLSLFGPLRSASGIAANVVYSREVEDTAVALLRFERGMCATVTVTHGAAEPQDTLRIFGTTGSIHVPVLNRSDLRIVRGSETSHESHPPPANLHQPLIQDFVDAIAAGRSPAVTGEVGRAVAVATSFAAL
jgi:predicted dehydrogenase